MKTFTKSHKTTKTGHKQEEDHSVQAIPDSGVVSSRRLALLSLQRRLTEKQLIEERITTKERAAALLMDYAFYLVSCVSFHFSWLYVPKVSSLKLTSY